MPVPHRRSNLDRRLAVTLLTAASLALAPAAAHAATGAPHPALAAPEEVTPLNFDVTGHSDVRTGIRGRVEIAGSFSGSHDRQTGAVTGTFDLVPTRAHVTALGLPVVAETDWVFTEPVTGSWVGGELSLRIAAKIRHPKLLMGGVVVAGGGKCATRSASVIELRASAVDDLPQGATLKTSGQGFRISALTGCGLLNPILSAVAAGSGNHAMIALTPPVAAER